MFRYKKSAAYMVLFLHSRSADCLYGWLAVIIGHCAINMHAIRGIALAFLINKDTLQFPMSVCIRLCMSVMLQGFTEFLFLFIFSQQIGLYIHNLFFIFRYLKMLPSLICVILW